MTSFEYVTIPVSIVLALGIGTLLSGVFSMFEHEKRDWLFLTWCLTLLLLFLGQWYSIWRLQVNESWNMLEFVVVMLSPILFDPGCAKLQFANISCFRRGQLWCNDTADLPLERCRYHLAQSMDANHCRFDLADTSGLALHCCTRSIALGRPKL